MSFLRLPSLILSFALLSCPIAVAAQPDQTVQHLTCLKDSRRLMCTIDETEEAVALKSTGRSTIAQTSEQLGQISNGLIGLIFIGLPIALTLTVIRHDKRDAERTKRLAQLERIWQES